MPQDKERETTLFAMPNTGYETERRDYLISFPLQQHLPGSEKYLVVGDG
jgi:hypothetical protein